MEFEKFLESEPGFLWKRAARNCSVEPEALLGKIADAGLAGLAEGEFLGFHWGVGNEAVPGWKLGLLCGALGAGSGFEWAREAVGADVGQYGSQDLACAFKALARRLADRAFAVSSPQAKAQSLGRSLGTSLSQRCLGQSMAGISD